MKLNKSGRTVTAGLMLALGILLPYATAHGFGMPGNILLPMHIPVLLCGFLCGPVFGAASGVILPFLNSILTGMPVLYPTGILMMAELAVYGLMCGLLFKVNFFRKSTWGTYIALIIAMVSGRIIYLICAKALIFFDTTASAVPLVAMVVKGMPGIVIQLAVIPTLVQKLFPKERYDARAEAVSMIEQGKATCVVVRDNKIVDASSPKGIYYLIELYEKGMLKNAFLADTIIGKAASMILSLADAEGCYGENMSEPATKWLSAKGISFSYKNKSEFIMNRKGDGMCPMEETVKDLNDEKEALEALKNKITELRKM